MTSPALHKILYVDDNPDMRFIVQLCLEALGGFTVQTCASGHEALHQAAGFGPQLLMSDIRLPGMDGPTLLGELRRQPALARLPALFTTAWIPPRSTAYYRSLGALGIISKPFDPMGLPTTVCDLWRVHHDRLTPPADFAAAPEKGRWNPLPHSPREHGADLAL